MICGFAGREATDGFGAVAQLGERGVRNAEVSGSIPLSSTIVSNFSRLNPILAL
jgi:hypothetical protein